MRSVCCAFCVCLAALPLSILVCGIAPAQQRTTRPDHDELLRSFLQEYVKQSRLPHDGRTRYIRGFVDLNGDSKDEVIVYLSGRQWCGTGGCTTLVLEPTAGWFRIVGTITIARPPIRVLDSTSNGWRDLAVWVQGGGIQPGYEAILPFNGKAYPGNPSSLPARRLAKRIEGPVVIDRSDGGLRLF